MGGLGSGRPSGTGRAKVEGCRSLDVNRLHREDCLRPGWLGNGPVTASGSPGSVFVPTANGCISPTACASAAAIGRTSTRASASSASHADTVERGPISCARASRTAERVGGASPSYTGPFVISAAAIVIGCPMRARARTRWIARCVAPIRSGSASAATLEWPRRFPRGRRACGAGHTSVFTDGPSRSKCAPRKQ